MLRIERIKETVLDLQSLHFFLEKAFAYVDIVRGGSTIIALGNTGCGKSTMLTSLIYGPEALEVKTIQTMVQILGGK